MAEFKIEWSQEARLDLYDILDFYILRNGNATYSRKLFRQINKRIRLLRRNAFLGRQTDFPNVRALITGDFEIIYEVIEDTILIAMIWDCRRNPDNKFIPPK